MIEVRKHVRRSEPMKPILTIVGPEASDIYDLLNINGDENVSICITQDNIREYLEIVDATDEVHHVSLEDMTVYVHEKKYYGFEHGDVILEENKDINRWEYTEKNSDGKEELVIGIE
jgi:hypothetical protein